MLATPSSYIPFPSLESTTNFNINDETSAQVPYDLTTFTGDWSAPLGDEELCLLHTE